MRMAKQLKAVMAATERVEINLSSTNQVINEMQKGQLYPFSFSTDEHVPLTFLMTKRLNKR